MKRKDSNMEIFKEWGSPRSNVQLFEAQEYCATCSYTLLKPTGNVSSYRVDLDDDTFFDKNKEEGINAFASADLHNVQYSDIVSVSHNVYKKNNTSSQYSDSNENGKSYDRNPPYSLYTGFQTLYQYKTYKNKIYVGYEKTSS